MPPRRRPCHFVGVYDLNQARVRSIDITSSCRLFAAGTEPGRRSLPAGVARHDAGKGRYGDRGRQKANDRGETEGPVKWRGGYQKAWDKAATWREKSNRLRLLRKNGKPNCGLVLAGLTCSPLGSHRRRPLTVYHVTFFWTKKGSIRIFYHIFMDKGVRNSLGFSLDGRLTALSFPGIIALAVTSSLTVRHLAKSWLTWAGMRGLGDSCSMFSIP